MVHDANPFTPFLADGGPVLLDGGLATTLEARGHVLDDRLWSAVLLRDDPDAIVRVHRAFLEAGADCITTASYQASYPGLAGAGFGEEEATGLLRRSTELARRAREEFLEAAEAGEGGVQDDAPASAPAHRRAPLVAASVGPYGAYLADGSEYDGRYGVSEAELDAFHRRRFEVLATSGADLLACETVPSLREAEVLVGILADIVADHPDTAAWMSFSCRDGGHLHDGTPIEDVARLCAGRPGIVAIGVNCTAPGHVPELIARMRKVARAPDVAGPGTLLLAYPNSGERYDAVTGTWSAGPEGRAEWRAGVLAARESGASIVGGCCRVGPPDIAELRATLLGRH